MKDKKIALVVSLIAIFVVIQFFFMRQTKEQEPVNSNVDATIPTGEISSSTTPELE